MRLLKKVFRSHRWLLLPLFFLGVWLLFLRVDSDPDAAAKAEPGETREEKDQRREYGYPTAQTRLSETNDVSVYMPTASGRVSSALYGSVRTNDRLQARFHAGIDIAPMERNRAGAPLDDVYAVREGRVITVNRAGGASSYGAYVVLGHDDRLGEIYTLYAHLAHVAEGIRAGVTVTEGQVLGRMGNTASTGIPMVRAHLHFEIGVLYNRHFEKWGRRNYKKGLSYGLGHGWNLAPVDPLALYGAGDERPRFCMAEHLAGLSPAFVVVFSARRPPDYFDRYPALWQEGGGGAATGMEAMAMGVSEAGTPVWGRPAEPGEQARLTRGRPVVLTVDEDVLGRNGMRLVARAGDGWQLTTAGERWLDILTTR